MKIEKIKDFDQEKAKENEIKRVQNLLAELFVVNQIDEGTAISCMQMMCAAIARQGGTTYENYAKYLKEISKDAKVMWSVD